MSTQQETFISHLIELRDRLIRALLVVVVVFVCLMPWAGDIYDILAKPMMDSIRGQHADLLRQLAIRDQTYATLFANDMGVMFGSGEVWINQVGEGDEKAVKIIGVNQ